MQDHPFPPVTENNYGVRNDADTIARVVASDLSIQLHTAPNGHSNIMLHGTRCNGEKSPEASTTDLAPRGDAAAASDRREFDADQSGRVGRLQSGGAGAAIGDAGESAGVGGSRSDPHGPPRAEGVAERRHYILIIRDACLWLVGPFETRNAAADYGATAERRRWADDPRWQTIELTNTYGIPVTAPDWGLRVVPGAYKRACGIDPATLAPEGRG